MGVLPDHGRLQAPEAIKLVLGLGESLAAVSSSTTRSRTRFREISKLRRDPSCPTAETRRSQAIRDRLRAASGRPEARRLSVEGRRAAHGYAGIGDPAAGLRALMSGIAVSAIRAVLKTRLQRVATVAG